MNKCLFPLLALLAASPAAAATLTEVDGLGPNRLALDLAQFSRPVAEACGSGRSVQTNGCSPVDAGALQRRFGRDGGVDSQDVALMRWDFTLPEKAKALRFTVQDAGDMPWTREFQAIGDEGALGTLAGGQPNGNLHTLEYRTGAGFTSGTLRFLIGPFQPGTQQSGDGFSIVGASVAPIPLPAAGWLLLFGAGALVAMKQRRRAVARQALSRRCAGSFSLRTPHS